MFTGSPVDLFIGLYDDGFLWKIFDAIFHSFISDTFKNKDLLYCYVKYVSKINHCKMLWWNIQFASSAINTLPTPGPSKRLLIWGEAAWLGGLAR